MILGILKNASSPGAAPARVGLITSRRVGGAVVRNRIRRRLREIVRLHRPALVADAWFVLVARRAAAEAGFAELEAEWLRLARKGGLLTRDGISAPSAPSAAPTHNNPPTPQEGAQG